MSWAVRIGLLVGLLLAERIGAGVLATLVGPALLATGPEVVLAALLGLACLALRLFTFVAVPVLSISLLPRMERQVPRRRVPPRVRDP